MQTWAPHSASACATAAPIPPLAPVTSARRPASSPNAASQATGESLEDMAGGAVLVDEFPIVNDAQPGSLGYPDRAVGVHTVKLITVAAAVNGRDDIRAVGSDERDLVVFRVAHRRHQV